MLKLSTRRVQSSKLVSMLAQMQSWALALVAMFLLAAPSIQTSESNEIDTTKERVEEVSLVVRSEFVKRQVQASCKVHAPVAASPFKLGHSLRQVFHEIPGHRLSNGLLAPMTC